MSNSSGRAALERGGERGREEVKKEQDGHRVSERQEKGRRKNEGPKTNKTKQESK